MTLTMPAAAQALPCNPTRVSCEARLKGEPSNLPLPRDRDPAKFPASHVSRDLSTSHVEPCDTVRIVCRRRGRGRVESELRRSMRGREVPCLKRATVKILSFSREYEWVNRGHAQTKSAHNCTSSLFCLILSAPLLVRFTTRVK